MSIEAEVLSAENAACGAALDASTLREHLAGEGARDWHVAVVATTTSTSSDLLASIRDGGYAGPAILAAEAQTGGRGRLGRRWTSAAGASLTVSYALRVARSISALDGVTLACGLAVRDVVARHGVAASLKWPNDLLVEGRKLAGILVEPLREDEATVLVIGIGINIAPTCPPGAVDDGALARTDLRSCGGVHLDRNRLAAELAVALRLRLDTFAAAGFVPFVDAWNAADAFHGRTVVLREGDGSTVEGTERGVDRSGALLLDVDHIRRRIVSGEVSLRPASVR